MESSTALKIFRDYQKPNLKPSAFMGYRYLIDNFEELFGDKDLTSISSEDIFHFLGTITDNSSKSTKKRRYSQLRAFFNFIIMNYEPDLSNPLDSPLVRKGFRIPEAKQREIIPKEVIDEVIFNSKNLRDRFLMELQPRCGARIGEALNIRVKDIEGRKIIVHNPKSGKESEVIFMPEQLANRLKTYIQKKGLREHDRVFPFNEPF